MGAGLPALRRPPYVAAFLLAAIASPLHAQQDTAVSEVVVEVSVARGPSATLFALARDTALLLPARAFLDLVAVRVVEVLPGRRLAGLLEPGNRPFAIETPTDVLTLGDSLLAIEARDVVWHEDELYVGLPVLSRLLGVTARMDWSELVLAIGNTDRLPAVTRRARDQRREALQREREPAPVAGAVAGSHAFVDGAVLDWALTSPTRGAFRKSSLQLGLGMQIAGGGLEVLHTEAASGGRAGRETHWEWSAAWSRGAWLRQVRLGEVSTGGPRPRLVRGIVLSNSPYLRPADFGEEVIGGRVGRGWEVESYRGGQLAGFADADSVGRFRLDVPVSYGPNPLDLVAYGPAGEVVRNSRALVVPTERLPTGRVEYSIGGGRCQVDACRDAFLADVRYGVSRRLTVQGGVDAFRRDTLNDLRHPWALASAGLLTSVNVLAEVVGRGLVRGHADFDPSPNFHLDVGRVRYDTTVAQPLVGVSSVRDQTLGSLFWRPGGSQSVFFVQAQASRSSGSGTTRDLERVSGTLAALGTRSVVAVQRSVTASGQGARIVGTTMDVSLDGVLGGPFRSVPTLVRLAVAGACAGEVLRCGPRAQRAALGVGRRLVGPVRLDLDVTWLRGRRGLGVDVGLTSTMSAMRAVSRNGYTPGLGVQGTQSFEGSVLYDRRTGRLDLGSGRAIGRGGVAGIVFEDLDGNGYRDEGEPGIGDVLLRVGSYSVHTDSLGRFSVSDLVPFEPTVIEIDTLALDNPLWVPASTLVTISPAPNSFRFATLPILIGGEVNGQLVLGDRTRNLGGIPVQLRHRGTGVVRTVRTFSDGAFYVAGLRPGTYAVEIAADVLTHLRVSMRPVVFTMEGRAGENHAEVTVSLEPVPGP